MIEKKEPASSGRIESGKANPTLGKLGKIVSGPRVNLIDLIFSPQDENYLIQKRFLSSTKEEKSNYCNYVYFSDEHGRDFEIIRSAWNRAAVIAAPPMGADDRISDGL